MRANAISVPPGYQPVYTAEANPYLIVETKAAIAIPAFGTNDQRIPTFSGSTLEFPRLTFTPGNEIPAGWSVVLTPGAAPREITVVNNPVPFIVSANNNGGPPPVGLANKAGNIPAFPRCVFNPVAAPMPAGGDGVIPAGYHVVAMQVAVGQHPVVSEINEGITFGVGGNGRNNGGGKYGRSPVGVQTPPGTRTDPVRRVVLSGSVAAPAAAPLPMVVPAPVPVVENPLPVVNPGNNAFLQGALALAAFVPAPLKDRAHRGDRKAVGRGDAACPVRDAKVKAAEPNSSPRKSSTSELLANPMFRRRGEAGHPGAAAPAAPVGAVPVTGAQKPQWVAGPAAAANHGERVLPKR